MNHASVIRFLRTPTARFTASYVLIIMVLSLGFSVVIYNTSAHELGRQLPPRSFYNNMNFDARPSPDFHYFFQHRIEEGRSALLKKLILLNVLALIGGAAISYYLARRNLQPIENAMEAQSRFVTDASHELRTPLTAILASSEVALRNPKLTLLQAKEGIKSNIEEMTKLKVLSDGLLSLARQDSSLVTHRPVSLQDIVAEAMNRVLPAAQAKKIAIEDTVPDITVHGDLQSLSQTVTILLDNAVKYSPEKSTIYLEGFGKDAKAYLSVRDTGSGISPKDMPHIFDRFYRADMSRTQSSAHGYGIGLAIAKKIAEQHDGRLTVSSTLGTGTTFVLELPSAEL